MPLISSPSTADLPIRLNECQGAIEAAFHALIQQAISAGWNEEEVCNALASLADNRIVEMFETIANAFI